MRPPPESRRAASSESWLTGQPSSHPPRASSLERLQTPAKTLVSSSISLPLPEAALTASSRLAHLLEPPVPNHESRASATRRDHGPIPCGIGGPVTQSTSPRRRRSTPPAT